MSDPIARKATKKKFHFPKSAEEGGASEEGVEAGVSAGLKKRTPAAKKAPKQQAADVPDAVSVGPAAESKVKRTKKEKVVRDSFTMPKSDYEKIAALKQKCLAAGVSVKKSEILRAGLLVLEAAAPKRLLAAVTAVEQVKTGRPAKS
ncbi:hypothetical protein PQR02_33995 [Paraburkholderia sediminicola]|uniref:Uncharacterized protein n=1 Tax=Paraburkholderia rhynchosiae TaxID=487049 RepID=A0ACC7NKJ9_9BURK